MNQSISISQEYKRIFSLAVIMTGSVLVVLGMTLYFMYETALSETQSRLVETAQSQARFFESVIEFDAKHGDMHGTNTAETFELSLGQLKDAHAKYKGFGKTGEFTLAKKEKDQIVFLLRHRHFDLGHPQPVPLDNTLAEPMRRALSGNSGTVIGLDYRGEIVLAAYEPVKAHMPIGIVAKIDLAEVRAPFIRTGIVMTILALLLIALGIYLFYRITQPMINSIRHNEAKFKNLTEMSSVAVYMADEKGKFVYVNPLWREHSGLDEADAMQDGWKKGLHPDDREWVSQEWEKALEKKGIWEEEYRFFNQQSGRTTWVYGMLREIRDPYNKIYGFVGVNIDITKRKEAEAQVQSEMQKRLDQERLIVQQTKMAEIGNMVAAVAHQWKQPLNAISLLSGTIPDSLTEDGSENEIIEEYCENINEQVQLMSKTMDDFRNFFKPSNHMVDFTACEIVVKVMGMFRNQFSKAGVEIITHPHEHFSVAGYPSEFMQVILNLFNNARDAIVEKGVSGGEINCFFSHECDWATIRIRDNGGGIPEDLLPDKLFDLYFTTKGESGTGIGLQISKSIIEDHMHGKLWVHNVDQGAEFVIELPLSKDSDKA